MEMFDKGYKTRKSKQVDVDTKAANTKYKEGNVNRKAANKES